MEPGWKSQVTPVRSWQTGRLDGQIYREPLLCGSGITPLTGAQRFRAFGGIARRFSGIAQSVGVVNSDFYEVSLRA
jgi:hypothetical protein